MQPHDATEAASTSTNILQPIDAATAHPPSAATAAHPPSAATAAHPPSASAAVAVEQRQDPVVAPPAKNNPANGNVVAVAVAQQIDLDNIDARAIIANDNFLGFDPFHNTAMVEKFGQYAAKIVVAHDAKYGEIYKSKLIVRATNTQMMGSKSIFRHLQNILHSAEFNIIVASWSRTFPMRNRDDVLISQNYWFMAKTDPNCRGAETMLAIHSIFDARVFGNTEVTHLLGKDSTIYFERNIDNRKSRTFICDGLNGDPVVPNQRARVNIIDITKTLKHTFPEFDLSCTSWHCRIRDQKFTESIRITTKQQRLSIQFNDDNKCSRPQWVYGIYSPFREATLIETTRRDADKRNSNKKDAQTDEMKRNNEAPDPSLMNYLAREREAQVSPEVIGKRVKILQDSILSAIAEAVHEKSAHILFAYHIEELLRESGFDTKGDQDAAIKLLNPAITPCRIVLANGGNAQQKMLLYIHLSPMEVAKYGAMDIMQLAAISLTNTLAVRNSIAPVCMRYQKIHAYHERLILERNTNVCD